MIVLVMGGSGSGKSAYAEHYIGTLSEHSEKYYIATMQVFDEEGNKKVKRHQEMRSTKQFITIEQPVCIEKAWNYMRTESGMPKTALLECISNLTANEMFSEKGVERVENVVSHIVSGVAQLQKGLRDLVIVTNNVFEDGIRYDETTMAYIKAMGMINQQLAEMADVVIEVVAGIALTVKEGT